MIYGKETFPDTERLPAHYLGKFNHAKLLPETSGEIAFIGRSNSGKSSLLRALLNAHKMPQVSSRPGSTRLIHIYQIGGSNITVADFPGYGYAQSSRFYRERFLQMLNGYLKAKRKIKALCLVMDVRRSLGEEESGIINAAKVLQIPILLCLNKSDQLRQKETTQVIKTYEGTKTFFEVLLVSAEKRLNLGYLRTFIASLGM
ncbi:MAG: GTP-binding protein EngB [Turneriella sp.]|nr:GTP-binding protein EngB [Turneriella sp.]